MTLRQRNFSFKAGIFIAFLAAAAVVISAFPFFSLQTVYQQSIGEAVGRPSALLPRIIAHSAEPSAYSVFASLLVSALYAVAGIIFIYYFFEKTQCPEIFFFSFFVFSFAFESCRAVLPPARAMELPSLYLTASYRVLLFGRCFGIFSLFAASIYAVGFEIQKQKYVIIMLIALSFAFAAEIPVDGFSWDTALSLKKGYPLLFAALEISVAAITLAGFLISVLTRGTKEYFGAALGVFLAFAGRSLLLNADTWASPILGIAALGLGTWLICAKLHNVYLWL